MSNVAIVKADQVSDKVPKYDGIKAVAEALKLLGGTEKFIKKGDNVFIKPNFGVPIPGSIAYPGKDINYFAVPLSTSPMVIEGIILEAKRVGAKKVVIGDGISRTGIVRSKKMMTYKAGTKGEVSYSMVYENCGGNMLQNKYPDFVELSRLEIEPRTKVKLEDSQVLYEFDMWQAFMDCDVFINVPIMKNHFITGEVTLAMKNLHGIIGHWMHLAHREDFWPVKVDIAKWLIDQGKWKLTVIDALHALEGNGPGPMGKPVDMGLIIASGDFVACDSVAMATMGLSGRHQPGLQLSAARGLGKIDLDQINVLGEKIENVRRYFQRPNINVLGRWPNFELRVGGVCDHCKGWLAMEVDSFFKSIQRRAGRIIKTLQKINAPPELITKLEEFGNTEILARLKPQELLDALKNFQIEGDDRKAKKAKEGVDKLIDGLKIITVPTQIFMGFHPHMPKKFLDRVIIVG
ncbi:MAG: DUF362 domain-containing protein, partial [Candidatus Hodarchaeota archaeon]